MNKIFVFSLSLACCCLASACPAVADAATNPPTSPKSSSSKASIPTRILGAVVGAFVGTPICFVRRSISDEKEGIRGIIGDTDNKVALVSAGAFWLPLGVATGFLEAPCYSFKHSMCHTDKPFSKEQFSLGNESE